MFLLIYCSNKIFQFITDKIFAFYSPVNGLADQIDELTLAAKHRSVAGVLASHAESRDVHLDRVTIRFHGAELLVDSRIELNCGRRYGLIGLNGCGKSSGSRALFLSYAGVSPKKKHFFKMVPLTMDFLFAFRNFTES